MAEQEPQTAQHTSIPVPPLSLGQLVLYFLKLGTIGFGGPAALVGYMRKDLVDEGQRIDESTYNLSIALAQIMPGPLAAQTAIAIGYFQGGVLGATLVGLAFIVPSFLMVLVLSWLYMTFGGLPWMQALFYGIGAVVIAIIAIAAYRLARGTNKSDPLLWGIFVVLLVATVWSQAELAALFILAGLVVIYLRAWPGLRAGLLLSAAGALGILGIWGMETFLLRADAMAGHESVLGQILLFFTKAGAFVFGSGLAIVPFLEQGVVHDLRWLNDHQFLDAVAVAMITPGPVVITVAFIGYLVAGAAGAHRRVYRYLPAGLYFHHRPCTVVPAPPGEPATAGLRRRGNGGRQRRYSRGGRGPRTAGYFRHPDSRYWPDRPCAPLEVPAPGAYARGRSRPCRSRDMATLPRRIGRCCRAGAIAHYAMEIV
jgi:chromate transporter